MFIITYKKIFFIIAGILVATSIGLIGFLGLTLGIEFTGGSTIEVRYERNAPPNQAQIENVLNPLFDKEIAVRKASERGYIIKTPFVTQDKHEKVMQTLSFDGQYKPREERFSSVGPVIGQELTHKAFIAISIVTFAIIVFVAFSFRRGLDKDGNPNEDGISSWFYGIAAIIALIFDVLLPTAMFAVLGVMLGAEVNVLFVTALLAILGFSVNDTIVVFDRVRENIIHNRKHNVQEDFKTTVGHSLEQTFSRSINTSLTTSLALIALYVFGAEVTQAFALTLLIGVIVGTYSSIFLASPLLVAIQEWSDRRNNVA